MFEYLCSSIIFTLPFALIVYLLRVSFANPWVDKKIKIKNEEGKFVKKIVNSIFQFNYTDVREYLYELTTKNIEKVDILKLVVKKIISCDLTEAQRFRIVELAGEYSAKMAICNKEVIQLEAFCFECMALFVIK